ncbi:exodeoxyribonuclease I [Tsuneonella deserti]|uniref:Exodeoxyribonuclease I n=1 Tax=Tsuneonella deserti TaxID=2035528 RepID=A0ABQ1S143_9SPHN|nr:exonuclease domain-containing protein [Tsuneonella deserti]GGD86991.1 exodeoxyribonuclease I [Tsuneonella deserti]
MAFVFYDTETTGISTGFDQILQFAAIRTDDNLKEIDRIELRCRLHPHVVPSPGALAVTGMTIDKLLDEALPCHYEMIREIRAKLTDWSPATFIGYNSLRFDEELLRKALFRTLHAPYLTNTGGNCRADALVLVQLASEFAPGCLKLPTGDKGNLIFKLDQVAPLNGFNHANAHDALADVQATIHLAQCVRAHAPALWERFLRFSTKASAQKFLEDEGAVVLTEFYFNRPYHFVVAAIGPEPGNSAAILALDLKHDLDWLAELPADQLATWVGKSPKKVRRVRTNACPSLAAVGDVPHHLLRPLGVEEIAQRAARLRDDPALKARLIEAALATAKDYETSPYVEEQIYSGGFVTRSDEALMARFHEVPWEERSAIVEQMKDERLRYHGRLIIHEMHPEVLNDEHRSSLESHMWERLLAEEAPKDTWTSLHKALVDTEQMMAGADPTKLEILAGLREHLLGRLELGKARHLAE